MRTKFQVWILKWILKDIFQQSPHHDYNAVQLFRLIRKAWANEFTEDNQVTQEKHLNELFEKSKE